MRMWEPHEIHSNDNAAERHDLQTFNEKQQSAWTRNLWLKDQLQQGETVQYHHSGWSLYPIVQPGDSIILEPVLDCNTLLVNDIVFCQLQPGLHFYAHRILQITFEDFYAHKKRRTEQRRLFSIGTEIGREIGWCYEDNIYGRMVECVP